ncbi:MAG: hypothetical protein NT062_11900, partial [Proteobacteria bacterium]|nr:hypothetical protein [Pseudomonadota bacterium]
GSGADSSRFAGHTAEADPPSAAVQASPSSTTNFMRAPSSAQDWIRLALPQPSVVMRTIAAHLFILESYHRPSGSPETVVPVGFSAFWRV